MPPVARSSIRLTSEATALQSGLRQVLGAMEVAREEVSLADQAAPLRPEEGVEGLLGSPIAHRSSCSATSS